MISAYEPTATVVITIAAIVLLEALVARLVDTAPPRRGLVWAAWLLAAAASTAGLAASWQEPAGVRMLSLILPLFYGMKVVVIASSRWTGRPTLAAWPWLGFTLFWPGMDPARFQRPHPDGAHGASRLLLLGLLWAASGMVAFAAARATWAGGGRIAPTILALVSLSLMVHFGLFHIVAAVWRRAGMDAGRLFRAPLRSMTLQEFWGRRWNVPFVEMMRVAVYRPLRKQLGNGPAALAAFLFSGFVHELAISVPARQGYGLPMLYFALHGVLLVIERRMGRDSVLVRYPWLGRAWTTAWVVVPAPMLFHPWFLDAVVWPLLR